METRHLMNEGVHFGFEVAKLTFKAAAIVAAFLAVKELHKVHRSIEERHRLAK